MNTKEINFNFEYAISNSILLIKSVWKFFAGCIITIIAFTTIFTDWKRPSINVEVTEVSSSISDKIDLELRPELSVVARVLGVTSNSRRTALVTNFNLEGIERSLKVKEKEENEYESNILKLERQVNSIIIEPITPTEKMSKIRSLELIVLIRSGRLFDIILSSDIQEENKNEDNDKDKEAQLIIEKIRKEIAEGIQKAQSKQAELKGAHENLKSFKEAAFKAETRLYVTAAIGNEGSGATSLRPQALLRANLGDGNYLDINLKIVDYPQNSELPPQSFKVIKFASDELRSMPSLDQDRFNNLFNNISPTNLYITDVRGNVMKSNTIPFSQGIYEQKVFDTLKSHASSETSIHNK